jgi:Arc/MetJ-type ribon-helix-helix transcriptional regulator
MSAWLATGRGIALGKWNIHQYDGTQRKSMKALHLELPDKVATELDKMVRAGWFRSEDELVRLAVVEFLRRCRPELTERFQRDDITWALREKETAR